MCLLWTACAAPSPNPTPSTGTSASLSPTPIVVESSMPIVAIVGSEEIGVDEFLTECLHEDSNLMRKVLEHVVFGRLIQLEAKRLGVALGADRLALAQAKAIAQVTEQVEADVPGMGLDDWITSRLGLDPIVFKNRIRARVDHELLSERVVRTWFLSQDRAEVLVLLTHDLATAESAKQRHAGGEEFSALAKELSVGRSGQDGGRTTPVVRGDTLMGTIAFDAELGEVAGPLEQQGRWLLVQVIVRHKGTREVWSEMRERVEQSLEERGVEELEFKQWKERMESVHPVDITPLFRLAGEPDF